MHNFSLLFLCEKEKNQNTSDIYCKKYRKMLDYAHGHKTSDKYKNKRRNFRICLMKMPESSSTHLVFTVCITSAVPSWGIMRMPRVKKHKYIGR